MADIQDEKCEGNCTQTGGGGERHNNTLQAYSNTTLNQIHVVALSNLAISTVISLVAISYLLKRHGKNLQRKTGERVVLYLALADLCYSSWHAADHAYVLLANNEPPHAICQCIVIVAIAINVLIVVLTRRELNFGKYDYRLLAMAFVFPQILCIVFAFCGYVGSNGIWCGFRTSNVGGRIVTQLNAIFTILVFIMTLLCYVFVLRIVKRSSKRVFSFAENTSSSRSQRQMASQKQRRMFRILTAFLVAFALQYWAVTLFFTWSFFSTAPAIVVFLTVTFTNQGGLFNCLAYIILRNRFRARTVDVTTNLGMSREAGQQANTRPARLPSSGAT